MPIETICPECGRALRVPDHLIGQPVQCPVCPAMFTAVASSEPKPNDGTVETFREPAGQTEAPPPTPPPIEEPVRRPLPRLDGDYDDDDLDDDEDDDRLLEAKERRYRERTQRNRMERAKKKVIVPAIGLMVFAGVNLLGVLLVIAFGIYLMTIMPGGGGGGPGAAAGVQFAIYGAMAVAMALFSALILFGAIRMKQQRMYGMAMTSCVLSVVASVGSCCAFSVFGFLTLALGLTFSIWGFIVLADPDVKASFE